MTYFLTVLLVFLLIGLVVVIQTWYRRNRLQPIQDQLPFEPSEYDPETLEATWQGHPVEIEYGVGGRHQPDWLEFRIKTDQPSWPTVRFRRERWYHRLSKWIGLSKEPQVGAYKFDGDIYISTDQPQAVQNQLSNPAERKVIQQLLELPKTSLSIKPGRLRFKIKSHWGWGRCFQPEEIRERFDRLISFCEQGHGPGGEASADRPAINRFGENALSPPTSRKTGLRYVSWVGIAAILLGPRTWYLGSFYPTITWDLHWLSAKISGLLLSFYLIGIYFHVSGHPHSHREFVGYSIAGGFGLPCLIIGSLLLYNGAFHENTSFGIQTDIREIRAGENEDYRLEVAPRERRFPDEIEIPFEGDVSKLDRNRPPPLWLLLSRGRLGQYWIKNVRLPPKKSILRSYFPLPHH